MGIYISNLEMPTNGDCISLKIYPDGGVFVQNTNYGGWKAIPVPDHGDLIDKRNLTQNAYMALCLCDKYGNDFQKPYEVLRVIESAPTIIPADKEEG